MSVRMWQNIKFTSFFMSAKNLHIKSFTLLLSRLFFMSRWIFTQQVYYIVVSCQFFNESTYLLFKFLALLSSCLYLYQLYGIEFFPCLHNFVERIKKYMPSLYSFINQESLVMTLLKRARAVWKLRALKFNIAAAKNFFIPNVVEFFETILSLFNQNNACLEHSVTRWRSSGVPIEKIRTIWTNFVRYVSTPNGNMSSPRGNQGPASV